MKPITLSEQVEGLKLVARSATDPEIRMTLYNGLDKISDAIDLTPDPHAILVLKRLIHDERLRVSMQYANKTDKQRATSDLNAADELITTWAISQVVIREEPDQTQLDLFGEQ